MKKLVLCASLAACTTVDSDNLLTSGMYADIAARAGGDGTTTVSATLFLEDPIELNFVQLTGDDQLVASFEDETRVMSETNILNIVSHHATFQADLEGDEFVVDFQRSVDNGAPESIATLPAPFDIVPPPASISRAAALDLDWQPAGTADLMSWSASGDCIETTGSSIPDDSGAITLGADTLQKRQGQQIADSCTVTIEITRSRLGILDRGYGEGGEVTGEQFRRVTFTSMP